MKEKITAQTIVAAHVGIPTFTASVCVGTSVCAGLAVAIIQPSHICAINVKNLSV